MNDRFPPRIMMISALAQSPGPAMRAMKEVWPEAHVGNLLDDSLASDYATLGELTPAIYERFMVLGRYAAAASDGKRATDGILFTCSAFHPAIMRVKAALDIPVLTPNEAAFEAALDIAQKAEGRGRIGLMLTFAGSAAPLIGEMEAIATARGQDMPEILPIIAEGAFPALQAGDTAAHDQIIAETATTMPQVDALVISQFSMAHTAGLVAQHYSGPLFTTPHMAARKLRSLVEGAGR